MNEGEPTCLHKPIKCQAAHSVCLLKRVREVVQWSCFLQLSWRRIEIVMGSLLWLLSPWEHQMPLMMEEGVLSGVGIAMLNMLKAD